MSLQVIPTPLPGVLLIELKVFNDNRGSFYECWQRDRHAAVGVPTDFAQDNISVSRRGVLRGLHYQHPSAQGKLVTVMEGEVYDVVADIRRGSPTFGRWWGTTLAAKTPKQLYIPPGYAHGFVVLSELAVFQYKCTDFYRPAEEGSIRWDDPDLGIDWPVPDPILSTKDAAAPRLCEVAPERLPEYTD